VTPRFGCVVVSMGTRPEELRVALESLRRQRGVETDVVVVGNAWEPSGLPAGVRGVALEENVGPSAGRNAGVPHVSGELLFFLDDDASLRDDDALLRIDEELEREPGIALVQPRVEVRGEGRPLREWVPRVGAGSPDRSGDVTAVWEGGLAARRSVFEAVGGWPAEFFVVHEGVDLAWRVMDAGWRVRYSAGVVVLHPVPAADAPPTRHAYSLYIGSRNRVWLARRHLPVPLAVLYVASFVARSLPRLRSFTDVREALRGYRDGMRRPCGPRRTLRARTLWRMTLAGRPPVI
jgi:GT2 family glycosyltransferase